jgi:hypothetical protein
VSVGDVASTGADVATSATADAEAIGEEVATGDEVVIASALPTSVDGDIGSIVIPREDPPDGDDGDDGDAGSGAATEPSGMYPHASGPVVGSGLLVWLTSVEGEYVSIGSVPYPARPP